MASAASLHTRFDYQMFESKAHTPPQFTGKRGFSGLWIYHIKLTDAHFQFSSKYFGLSLESERVVRLLGHGSA
eukprot:s2738_g4.t1